VLEHYNEDLTLTREEDAVFAQLARERTARHPLRTYLWISIRRAVRIWFTPRIELLPVSGHVFPLAYMREEDPVDQRMTILIFFSKHFVRRAGNLGRLETMEMPQGTWRSGASGVLHRGAYGLFDDAGDAGARAMCSSVFPL